jgi:quinol monooxygenase YgiN
MSPDTSVSFHPYFKIHAGKIPDFKALCQRFVEKTRQETGCLYYGFTFDGDVVYCREGYVDAAALLTHVENVGAQIQEALTLSDVVRLEAHGPASELEKLRGPLAALNPQYFVLEVGIRK